MAHNWDAVDDFLLDNNSGGGRKGEGRAEGGLERPGYGAVGQERKGVRQGLVVHAVTVMGPTRRGSGTGAGVKEYLCRCVCGREVWVRYADLYYGTVRNCGCREWTRHPAVRLEGKAFGRLAVGEWVEEGAGGWKCKCHRCGEELVLHDVGEIRRAAHEGCGEHASRAR